MNSNLRSIIINSTNELIKSGSESARLDATILLAHILGVTREYLILEEERIINDEELEKFNILLKKRINKEPIAYIIGKKEFWGLDFIVNHATLIPRPDSETLVEAALERANILLKLKENLKVKNLTILDIGTGTACLLISLLRELPTAFGIGVDISKEALQVANKNAEIHGVKNRTQFINSDWCKNINGKFDLIISNPPYIASSDEPSLMPDVALYEPHYALFSGVDGLDSYRELSAQIGGKLNQGGFALFEVGDGQAETVSLMLSENGFRVDEIKKDLSGIKRCVIAQKMN